VQHRKEAFMVRNDWQASTWIGRPVRNSAGATIGKIEDVVVNPDTGAVTFGILSSDGWLGIRDRYVAVPWSLLGFSPNRDYVLLDVDKNVLESAPSFDRAQWPDLSDPAWRSRVYGHYGYPDPALTRDQPVVVHREHREYRQPRKEMSVFAALFLILVLLGLLGFTYMVATRGWTQAQNDVVGGMHGVTYAMKEAGGDAALTAKVKTALSLNKRIPAGMINVDSSNGVVTLRGDISDDQARTLAETVASDTPGVREVQNQLSVAVPSAK